MHIFGEVDQNVVEAFGLVAKYDWPTYSRMVDADWWVTSDPDAKTHPVSDQWVMDTMNPVAIAVTDSPWQVKGLWGKYGYSLSRPYTLVNVEAALYDAKDGDLEPMHYLATILVHEFQHTQPDNHDEAGAYAADEEFTRKLPADITGKLLAASKQSHANDVMLRASTG